MTRWLIVVSSGILLLGRNYGAEATIYGATPYPLIAPTSTTTFQAAGFIPTRPGASSFLISPDGKTAYFPTCVLGANYPCPITAMDLGTGKTLRAFQTKYIPLGPMAILPDESQLYVATDTGCDSGGCGLGYVEVFDPASGRELAVIDTFPNESYAIPAVALSVAPTGGPSICYSAMKVLLAQDGWRRLIRLL